MVSYLIRRGLYAIPVGGVFILARSAKLTTDPQGYAWGLISASHIIGGYLYLAGIMCLLFGVLALYGYLATSRAAGTAAAGMVISVIAVSLLLPIFGVAVLADAVLGDVYLAEQTGATEALRQLAGGTFSNRITAYFAVFLVVGLIGAVVNATAVWRSGRLPKWAGLVALTMPARA